MCRFGPSKKKKKTSRYPFVSHFYRPRYLYKRPMHLSAIINITHFLQPVVHIDEEDEEEDDEEEEEDES